MIEEDPVREVDSVSLVESRWPWQPCPPCICFHCAKPQFACLNHASCNHTSGMCEECPTGFGGEDCSIPLGNSPLLPNDKRSVPPPFTEAGIERNAQDFFANGEKASGNHRPLCDAGWSGLTCNVCSGDAACGPGMKCHASLLPCSRPSIQQRRKASFSAGLVVDSQESSFAACRANLPAFLEAIIGKGTEVTSECRLPSNSDDSSVQCDLQFWLDAVEQIFCRLEDCHSVATNGRASWKNKKTPSLNNTENDVKQQKEELDPTPNQSLVCSRVRCLCVKGAKLCSGATDISGILGKVSGPASIQCSPPQKQTSAQQNKVLDGDNAIGAISECLFSEPYLNDYFAPGDPEKDAPGIKLSCMQGQCLLPTEVPTGQKNLHPVNESSGLVVIAVLGLVGLVAVLLAWFIRKLHVTRKILGGAIYRAGPASSYTALQSQPDEHGDHELQDVNDFTVQFSGLSFETRDKCILQNVSGQVASGQLMAILGGSGAGKSTCLELIGCKKNTFNNLSGSVMIDGVPVGKKEMRFLAGWVDQEDCLMPTLTVRETLMLSALLRGGARVEDAGKRVDRVIDDLGLSHVADCLVGSPSSSRLLSGGERRRVSIGQALVHEPRILLLDEPTSGLDAHSAHSLVSLLARIASSPNSNPKLHLQFVFLKQLLRHFCAFVGRRAVVLTIHQPRSDIFAMFDKVLVLAKGKTVYSGDAENVVPHFESLSKQACPPGYNAADFVIDVSQQLSNDPHSNLTDFSHGDDFARYNPPFLAETSFSNTGNNFVSGIHSSLGFKPSAIDKFVLLSTRHLLDLVRNPFLLLGHWFVSLAAAVLLGALFWGVRNDLAGVQNRLGCIFFVCAFLGFGSLTAVEVSS